MLLQIHVCLLSGLIFLSLLEKRPLRIANSDNLPETVTGWGWEYSAPGIFQPYLKTLHHLLFSCSYWYVIFSFIHVQIQNDRRGRAKKNKRNQFVIFSPSLLDSKQTQTYFCKCCFFIVLYLWYDCFWSWSQIYCLWCLHAVRLSPAPNVYILDIISGCPHSILGRNGASFIFCVIMR